MQVLLHHILLVRYRLRWHFHLGTSLSVLSHCPIIYAAINLLKLTSKENPLPLRRITRLNYIHRSGKSFIDRFFPPLLHVCFEPRHLQGEGPGFREKVEIEGELVFYGVENGGERRLFCDPAHRREVVDPLEALHRAKLARLDADVVPVEVH